MGIERDIPSEIAPEEKSDLIIGGQEFDLLTSPEIKWKANFALLVISGKPGSGTSSLARGLKEKYDTGLFTAGDIVRKLSDTPERAPGFIERDRKIDEGVDNEIRQMVIRANKENPSIAEAQIGCLTALDAQRNLEKSGVVIYNSPIIRILLRAEKDIRYERLLDAARKRGEDISLEQIEQRTSARELGDNNYWRELYPDLIGEDDPLEKEARDARGELIYDIEIDNSEDSGPEQTMNEMHIRLMRMGLVSPILPLPPTDDDRLAA